MSVSSTGRCLPFLGSIKITSPFGPRRLAMENYVMRTHLGMDMVGIGDTTVVSITSGTVKRIINSGNKGFGLHVWVWNDDGTSMVYAHLKSTICVQGQRLTCKTPIGIMGSTGNSTGAHLHIGIFVGETTSAPSDKAIDPAIYFNITDTSDLSGKYLDGSGYIAATTFTVANLEELERLQQSSSSLPSSYQSSYNIQLSSDYYQIVEGSEQYLDVLYGRRYRILIADKNGNVLDVSSLRCSFDLIKSWTNYSETSTVTIYNLSPEHENQIINEGKTVYIEAGYSGKASYGLIYVGTVIQALRGKEGGVDYKLTLLMANTANFNNYSILGVTVNSQNNMRKVLSEVASKAGDITKENYGISLGKITETADAFVLPRGKILFGKSSKILNQISKTLNSTCYIEDGKINIISPETVDEDVIFDLGPDTGLIGSPVQNSQGVSVSCLLNPRFDINKLFHLQNVMVQTAQYTLGNSYIPLDSQGIYRIIRIEHTGDTRGNEWFTKLDALSQIGSLPSVSSNAASVIM